MTTDARVIALGVLAALCGSACDKPEAVALPPPEVYVVGIERKDVPVYLDLVGETAGFQDVEIRARVEGFLDTVNFREGSFVKAGDLLYQIDRKPLTAILSGAKADLATAKARLDKATGDVNRYTPLAAKQAVSQEELDDARAAQTAARTQVEALEAAVEKARLDLSYTRITSPIAGLVGTTKVNAGNLVGRGESTLLTTVSKIDPIIFKVGVTEADYLRIIKRDPSRAGKEPRAAGIELTLADGTVHPQTGTLGPVDREVTAATGTLGVQIIFPNPQSVLRPGQVGRARVLIESKQNAMLVPQRAVQELQDLHRLAVVTGGNKVEFRNVKVGPRVDALWVIEDGIKPDDMVVAEGLQAVSDGMTVRTKAIAAAGAGASAGAAAGEGK